MKTWIFTFAAAALLAAGCASAPRYDDPDTRAASDLAHRLLGKTADKIVFRIAESESGDVFRLASEGSRIVISGNNANSMAVGLNHYLKYYCHVNVGWFAADKFQMPARLPKVDAPVEIKARVEDRFFLNYCTFGYTMPWWQWGEWEHFIDWMALQGINLPLAITGQEAIWYRIWTEMGLTDEEVRTYFTGPAHLPWHRMLNIDHWGSPLPMSWLDGQAELQKKIVARERELNMKPVLPAFAGHVPPELNRIHPEAQIERMSDWAGFDLEDYPYFLDPMDPLFPEIQKKFVEKETEIYGTDHIYGIDLFNEMIPKSWEPDYLSRVSRQCYESLAAVDPDAVWLQMTWLFWNERKYWTQDKIQPYITSYPAGKSLLLDYYCERQEVWRQTQSYYGVPFIWCYLGNFGGNTYLAGNFADIAGRIEGTFAEAGPNFKGLGSTLEGFDCNPFMYQFIFEKAWDSPRHQDLAAYGDALADARVGKVSEAGREAWKILLNDIYVDRSVPGHSPILNLRPSFGRSSSYHSSVKFTYENEKLLEVVKKLLEADGQGGAWEFDIVNLTRQYLSNRFETVFADYKKAYEARDREAMAAKQADLLATFDNLEELLSTNSYFLVGKWIADARSWGATPEEADYYESNARNLLTTWGDRGNILTDYADRTWAGLVSTYYKGRWEMFFRAVNAALDAGAEFDEEALKEQLMDFEKAWWAERPGTFDKTPHGDPKAAVEKVLAGL
jgi:alpha-N-acetylglucosaminidase